MKKNPYENNDYLKNNDELVKEMLFFKKFQIPMEKDSDDTQKEKDDEEDMNI